MGENRGYFENAATRPRCYRYYIYQRERGRIEPFLPFPILFLLLLFLVIFF